MATDVDVEELLDDPVFIIRAIALHCASSCFAGVSAMGNRANDIIKIASKFEAYLMGGG